MSMNFSGFFITAGLPIYFTFFHIPGAARFFPGTTERFRYSPGEIFFLAIQKVGRNTVPSHRAYIHWT
jgi:hypothetical protein